jgi:hypothetical protein
VLEDFLARQRERFAAPDANPASLLADEGQPQPALPSGVTVADLAAWTATARVVLNLDEAITRE